MENIAESQTPEPAPVEATSQLTPAPADDFDRLLADYEANTAKPEPAVTDEPVADGVDQNATSNELDQLLAQLSGPDPKINALETELAGVRSEADRLRSEMHRQQEWAEFQSYAKSLQDDLPSHLPDGYAELKLKALAHDPTIAAAFDYRNVDRHAASAELARAQLVMAAFQRANDPRIPQLTEYMNKLNVAINSQAILRKVRLDILNEANKLPPPIDPEATELKAEIAWNMKSQGKKIAEPPPNFGRMTDQEFRDWKLTNLGWA